MSTSQPQAAHSASGARRSFVSALHLFGQYVVMNVISLPVTAFIVRTVGKDQWGNWGAAAAVASVAMLFTNLGLRGTFVRSVAHNPDSAPTALAEQLGIRLPLCFVSSAVVMVYCWAVHYSNAVLTCAAVYCVWIFLNATMSTMSDLLQGLQRMSVYAVISFISGLLITAVSAFAAWRWPTALSLSLAYLVGPLVTSVMVIAYVRHQGIPVAIRWKKGRFGQMWHESRFMAVQQVVNTVGMQLESLVLPAVAGTAVFGLFNAGLLLASRLWMIPDALSTTFYPLIAQAHSKSPEEATEEAGRSLILSALVCLPVAVAVMYFAPAVSQILMRFHDDAAECRTVIYVTIWALPMWSIESMMGFGLNAAHRDAAHARQALLSVMANIFVGGILMWKFGLIGACWSYILRVALRIAFVQKPFRETFPGALQVGRLIRLACCGALMGGAMWLVRMASPNLMAWEYHATNVHQWITVTFGLFVEGAVGSIVYLAAIFVFRVYTPGSLMQLLKKSSASRGTPTPVTTEEGSAQAGNPAV